MAIMLPLDIAELVLIAAIRSNVTVCSLNADAVAILDVLGPRQEFPSITDSALHHMIWISLDSIAQAGDTWLLGRLLDPTLPKPNPPIRTLRSSPHVLARASEAGHLDFLGYWLRLVQRYDVASLTLTMVRRAISAAVRAEQMHVVDWWLDAVGNVFDGKQGPLNECWDISFEAGRSKCMLDHVHAQWTKATGLALHTYDLASRALRRAHGEKNAAAVDWWLTQVPQLQVLRFMLPRIMRWKRPHFKYILYLFRANELGLPSLNSSSGETCQRLCWWAAVPLLFADLGAWRTHEPKVFEEMVARTSCKRCLNIIFHSSPSSPASASACPILECAHDHCVVCALPDNQIELDKLAEYNMGTHSLIDCMCKHGHAEGLRVWLRLRRSKASWLPIPPHALHVASKHGHVEVLKVWLEECQDDDFRAYPLWDGVGLSVLDWLLEHDVDCKWLRWMSLDEVSRAGQTHVLDWWLIKFREGRVPVLRFSYKALQFKSYESGVKSLRWWLRSGLLFEDELPVVSVWRYCYFEQFDLVEMLVAGGVPVTFSPVFRPSVPIDVRRTDAQVVQGIEQWWQRRAQMMKGVMVEPVPSTATLYERQLVHELECRWTKLVTRSMQPHVVNCKK